MNALSKILVSALLCTSTYALAAGASTSGSSGYSNGTSGTARAEDTVIKSAQEAIAQREWGAAQTILKNGLANNPQNADYHNLLAFSTRKGPNPDMAVVFEHYREALRLNPYHLGAHEYVGEAYLTVNDLAKAKEHLQTLNRLCFLGCAEFYELKKAVALYEANPKP